jgi:hypothetical protein
MTEENNVPVKFDTLKNYTSMPNQNVKLPTLEEIKESIKEVENFKHPEPEYMVFYKDEFRGFLKYTLDGCILPLSQEEIENGKDIQLVPASFGLLLEIWSKDKARRNREMYGETP